MNTKKHGQNTARWRSRLSYYLWQPFKVTSSGLWFEPTPKASVDDPEFVFIYKGFLSEHYKTRDNKKHGA